MKIKCEKCGKDISFNVDQKFEQFIVGRVECPECHKKQSRCLTQFDYCIYLTVGSLTYLIIAYAMMNLIDITGFKWLVVIALFALYLLTYFLLKTVNRSIYLKAPFKKQWMNNEIYEDSKKVRRTLRIEFSIYISLVFILSTGQYDIWSFIAICLGFTTFLLIKTYLAYKKEKTSIKL